MLGVDLSQLHLQRLVPYATGRSRALPCGVVRRRGDLQFATDRLDPEALAVGLDEAGHSGSRGSSSQCEKNRGRLQNLVGAAQLAILALELPQPLPFPGRQPRSCTCIDLSTPHPRP